MGGEGDEEEQSRLNFFPRGLLSRPHERKPVRLCCSIVSLDSLVL